MPSPPIRTALARGPSASFATVAGRYLAEYLAKIEVAAKALDEDALWWRPAPGTNSIGNLILHLDGNLSLWIGEGVGRTACERDRAGEFRAERSHDRAALLGLLSETVHHCIGTLDALEPIDLDETIDIQGYSTNVLGAVFHAVEHMSYHTGQILWAAKQVLGDRAQGHGIEFYPQHSGE